MTLRMLAIIVAVALLMFLLGIIVWVALGAFDAKGIV
jgi:hypothetical protein